VPPPIVGSVVWHNPAAVAGGSTSTGALYAHQQEGGRQLIASHISSSRPLNAQVNLSNPNPVAVLQRRERAIQKELQILLDAQSAGLLHGRTGPAPGTEESIYESSEGSKTPTRAGSEGTRSRSRDGRSRSQSYGIRKDTGGVIPVRQPRKQKISLRGARRGIASSIADLHTLKSHESDITNQTVIELKTYLTQVSKWETKLGSFSTSISEIGSGSEAREISELQTEKGAVENEIRDLEDRLLGLKARDRHLGAQIHELENRKEAKVSSFKEGRRGVEVEVREFLKRPLSDDVVMLLPVQAVGGDEWSNTSVADEAKDTELNGEGAMFLTLPPKRRTLEMAKVFLSGCISAMETQATNIANERIALDEGARMWDEGISQVVAFEEELYREMKADASALKDASKSKSRIDSNGEGPTKEISNLKARISKMDSVISDLEAKVRRAETEGWNLLICGLGAEMEAFREGRGILHQVLGDIAPDEIKETSLPHTDDSGQGHGLDEMNEGTDGTNGVRNGASKNGGTVKTDDGEGDRERVARREVVYRSETESEDDGPHPDLLVSQDDEDEDV
jgi:predicted  nucleic acid-binding Zn-ribbon protein